MNESRESHEAGHRRKFLVVVDETPECERALFYAGHRAVATQGSLVLLAVVPPSDFQHWLGVENIMREDAHNAAAEALENAAGKVKPFGDISVETVIRDGHKSEEILTIIEEDKDIAILVLGAGIGKEGPGPLVAMLGRTGGDFPIPVTIVPGTLTDKQIEALS